MKILADENIARVADYFGWAGELVTLPGRAITAAALQDVDALLVRSVTQVNAALLADSRCRFVGTATSGIDHVDIEWLARRGIGFGHARGCNANAVVEYVFSALAGLAQDNPPFDWRQCSYGIIGCGEVGSRLARKLQALGISFLIHDPFLAASHPLAAHFAGFNAVLEQDVITLHTPITRDGEWPTWHMLNADMLARLSVSGVLINAARGAVVDNEALVHLLRQDPGRKVVLDAWEGEPEVSRELLQRVTLGTPHIAGYSREGKLNGTRMLVAGFCAHFGLPLPPVPAEDEPDSAAPLRVDSAAGPLQQLDQLVLQAYDVRRDHRAMQALRDSPAPGKLFDSLRRNYPQRPEFAAWRINTEGLAADVRQQAVALGFRMGP